MTNEHLPRYTLKGPDGRPGILFEPDVYLAAWVTQSGATALTIVNHDLLLLHEPVDSPWSQTQSACWSIHQLVATLLVAVEQYPRQQTEGWSQDGGFLFGPEVTAWAYRYRTALEEVDLLLTCAIAQRETAYAWHGGQGSALYALASSGRVADKVRLRNELSTARAGVSTVDDHERLSELMSAIEEFPLEGDCWIAPWAVNYAS